jgi:hypothetical protein
MIKLPTERDLVTVAAMVFAFGIVVGGGILYLAIR